MATKWMNDLLPNLGGEQEDGTPNGDIFNTKEDAEVLKGLFVGRYVYTQFHDAHAIKRAKMWDTL